ncbi:MAG: CpsD/CapB family tyrosine-protein kinase [Deltaproteobacteria bacterium]|nr:CpsD/CapB family tyrosine-protein kinase [Deltaproteobacteria bacterium]
MGKMTDALKRGGRTIDTVEGLDHDGDTVAHLAAQATGAQSATAPPPSSHPGNGHQLGHGSGDGGGGGIRLDEPPGHLESDEKERLVSFYAPGSPEGKRIDILRSQLLYPFHGDPPRIIMVTSAVPREGRSLLTANLAISFARGMQQYVLVVDCNIANPYTHRLLGVPLRPGLADYLEHDASLPDVIHWSKVDKLAMIPAGSYSKRSSELLATDKMVNMIHELRERYKDRYIILDTPSVQAVDDPAVLARVVEGIIFVVLGGSTDREVVLRAIRSLPEEKIVGLVINDALESVNDAPNLKGGGALPDQAL